MSFKATKVYRDGYHYVAIPYKENPTAKKRGGVTDFEKDKKKKAFDTAYKGVKSKSKKKRTKELITELRPHFETEEQTAEFVKAEMERAGSSQVTNQEVAKKMDIEPEKIDTYLSAYTSTVSIEGTFDANNGSELAVADVIADTKASVEECIEYEELKKEIANVVSVLKEREQTVIKMRFGLENFTKTTLEDIGKIFGVTKECIRQTEMRALNKLRNSLSY